MLKKSTQLLEYDKVLNKLLNYAVLDSTKTSILNLEPTSNIVLAKHLLEKTNEAYALLYNEGVSNVEYFEEMFDEPERASRGGMLSFKELLKCAKLLRASRILKSTLENSITNAPILKDIATKIYTHSSLENDIFSKIINETQMADNASLKLYNIRNQIKEINEKIRLKLSAYMRKDGNKFMQDNVVSMRSGRYVIPVKSEYVTQVNGFIHDRSASGNTFFVEPQEILTLNNELRSAVLSEGIEVERILLELSNSVGQIATLLNDNVKYLTDVDLTFSKAHYAFSTKSVYPNLNANGKIDVIKGRHPLIDASKVVPVSVKLGYEYRYVLISGPNTGGKTVTLKLVGLLTLMAMSGMFVPCQEGSTLSVFNDVCVDIGDEQSIEQNLSTFSSHLKNIVNILKIANEKCLVLIDELGAGTDPDEGSALALAVIQTLVKRQTFGLVTTHFNSLKEYAYSSSDILNASMEFDNQTFAPLYKLRSGLAGSSNAIEIAVRLGLDKEIANLATGFLSSEKVSFNNMIKEAEMVKEKAEKDGALINELKLKQQSLLKEVELERQKLEKDKEKLLLKAKLDAKKTFENRLFEAEELLEQMKDIFNKAEYQSGDLVKMSTLKNKIENAKYNLDSENNAFNPYEDCNIDLLKKGDKVYVKSLNGEGEVLEVNKRKNCVWVMIGALRLNCKIGDISYIKKGSKQKNNVAVSLKRESALNVKLEVNVIGLDASEAIIEVQKFLDEALLNNLEEVRIVHGKGLKILSSAIHNYLKNRKEVVSFRFGKYGEGEHGVTIVTLK